MKDILPILVQCLLDLGYKNPQFITVTRHSEYLFYVVESGLERIAEVTFPANGRVVVTTYVANRQDASNDEGNSFYNVF